MVTIGINGQQRENTEGIEAWVNDQITRRRQNNEVVCVEVYINLRSLDIRLLTPGCATGTGGSRPLTDAEQRICDLWSRLGLNEREFNGGQVVAFLKQLRRYL